MDNNTVKSISDALNAIVSNDPLDKKIISTVTALITASKSSKVAMDAAEAAMANEVVKSAMALASVAGEVAKLAGWIETPPATPTVDDSSAPPNDADTNTGTSVLTQVIGAVATGLVSTNSASAATSTVDDSTANSVPANIPVANTNPHILTQLTQTIATRWKKRKSDKSIENSIAIHDEIDSKPSVWRKIISWKKRKNVTKKINKN